MEVGPSRSVYVQEAIETYIANNLQAIVDAPEVFFQWQPAYDHVLPWHLTLKKDLPKEAQELLGVRVARWESGSDRTSSCL